MSEDELRELAKNGAEVHSPGMPEHAICIGLLAAFDEIVRLRAEVGRLRATLHKLEEWAEYYPLAVFKGVRKIVREALPDPREPEHPGDRPGSAGPGDQRPGDDPGD